MSRVNWKNAYYTIILLFFLTIFSCDNRLAQPVSRSEFHLGTICTVTLYDRAPRGVFSAVFAKVAEIEEKMSVTIKESEVSRINEKAGIAGVAVSEDTFSVITTALSIARMSQGSFDPTVGPLVKLWGIGTDAAAIPEEEELRAAADLVDYSLVSINRETREVFLEREGMKLDLGGIAKGYAADSVVHLLKEWKVEEAIVDFGGNVVTVGKKNGKSKWRVGIQSPEENRGDFLGILSLYDASVVTSGNYERYFIEEGKRYHHILDTETGFPVWNSLDSATIITVSSTEADALSTAVYSLGLERGLEFVASLEGVEAIFVTSEKKVFVSRGIPEIFSLTAENYSLIPLNE